MGEAPASFPSDLPFDVSSLPKLSREQAGHLRHFHNISTALDGDWRHMGAQDPEQAFLDAYRYQLATMVYASSVAHYHRLPAMRSVFKPLIRRLIIKMLRRDVWSYWYLTSQSGKRIDPSITELRKPWADPIIKENIMYSGHLLLMTSLYAMLFDDDEFEKPGSLTFNWNPMFWGMGPEKFEYDNGKLQDAILKEMEREGWGGVCCEPNNIFVVCNQFPIIAMRYNDVRHGTNIIEGVLEKYWKALQDRGMISPNGLFVDTFLVRQKFPAQAKSMGFTVWACAYMNSWNSSFVRANFERQSQGYITTVDGKTEVQHTIVGLELRRLIEEENAPADSAATLQRARAVLLSGGTKNPFPYEQPLLGYATEWLSELGKTEKLDSLLAGIEETFSPSWENGGLYYPRNDQVTNAKGEWTLMDPFSGNAAIGYARLNVEDGQKMMWEAPWTKTVLESKPWVDGLGLDKGLDCLRGYWDEKLGAVIVTLKAAEGVSSAKRVEFSVENLDAGNWAVYEAGKLVGSHRVEKGGRIPLSSEFKVGDESDFVVLKERGTFR